MSAFIKVSGLYKVFGDKGSDGVTHLKDGLNKDTIMQQHGLSVGLNNICLEIEKGETFVVMGLSGSGKSTLIRHFNRLIEPTEGRIEIDGVDICSYNKQQIQHLRRHQMSMVFQRFGLLPHRTIIQNVAYGLSIQGIPAQQANQKAQHWLDMVGLNGYENQYPNQLSGGQQQRVGLARALCTDPDILLMDEAFSALDPLIRSEMQQQLKELQQKLHKTIIFITHDLDEALRLGDRIAILKDGELVQQGKPVDILLNPQSHYVASFVKDINRSRALLVKHAYQPAKAWLNSEVAETLLLGSEDQNDIMLVNEGGQYQGSISLHQLRQVIERNSNLKSEQIGYLISRKFIDCRQVPVISIEQSIESVLPDLLANPCPLPVLDFDGKVIGQLEQAQIASILVPNSHQNEQVSEI